MADRPERSGSDDAFFALMRKERPTGAYYFCGAEELAKDMALKKLQEQLNPAVLAMNVQRLASPSAADIINAAETLPFFDEGRVVIVENPSAEDREALLQYLPGISPTTTLIFLVRGEAKKTDPLFAYLAKQKRVISFEPYSEQMAIRFVCKRARENQINIDQFVARSLVLMVGVDLNTLLNALLTVGAYAGYGLPVSEKHLRLCLSPDPEYSVFEILDALCAGNKKAAMLRLTAMMKDGEPPMKLTAFFEGRLKQIFAAKEFLNAGMKDDAAAKQLGGSPYAAKKTVQNAKRLPAARIKKALVDFGNVDLYQKQGRMKDADALYLAVIENF